MNKLKFLLVPLLTASFLASCNSAKNKKWYEYNDWWNYCSSGKNGEQAMTDDIGKEVNVTVNGQVHKVRLIGVEHDILSDDTTKKAHCTFEFSNLLSDSNGYSLATLWNTEDGTSSTNYDYENSDLRTALDGIVNGAFHWYQKGDKVTSTNYTKPVIEMLPSELKTRIKTVKKEIATGSSYTVNNYDAKVFALTYREMTKKGGSSTRVEGATYQYYVDHDDNSSRIKHQVKWYEGATTKNTEIIDLNWHPSNYAGYNDNSTDSGGYYWIASPDTDGSSVAIRINADGYLACDSIYSVAYAVAPAFCI